MPNDRRRPALAGDVGDSKRASLWAIGKLGAVSPKALCDTTALIFDR